MIVLEVIACFPGSQENEVQKLNCWVPLVGVWWLGLSATGKLMGDEKHWNKESVSICWAPSPLLTGRWWPSLLVLCSHRGRFRGWGVLRSTIASAWNFNNWPLSVNSVGKFRSVKHSLGSLLKVRSLHKLHPWFWASEVYIWQYLVFQLSG